MCMQVWGKIMDNKIQDDQKKPTATSEEPGAKVGYCTCPLYSTSPKGWTDHLTPPSDPTHGHIPNLTPCNEPAPRCLGEQVRKPVACSRSPPAAAGASVKP